MDGTLFIAAAMVLIIVAAVLAFVLVAKNQSKKEKQKIAQQLNDIAKRHNLHIGEQEQIKNRVIAMDKDKTTLIYIDSANDIHHLIEIAEITKVEVAKKGKNISHDKRGKLTREEHIDSIELALSIRNREVVYLPFYVEVYDGILDMLPLKEKAEQWRQRISGN